jgi:fructokinase
MDETGRALARHRIDSPRGDYDATVRAIAGLVHNLEKETGRSGSVGVGIPGAISPATGLVKNANSTWLIGRPLDRDLSGALSRPIRLANDANCFALSEATDGAAREHRVVFGVILGTGVGGGLVVDRTILRGRQEIAGEWGHNPLPWPTDEERPGPTCYCGKNGCIETFVSGPGLSRSHAEATGECKSTLEIAAAARLGESHARASLEAYAGRLSRGLSSVINVLDPDAVVLGGGLSQIAELYPLVTEQLSRWAFSDRIDTPVLPPLHGDASGVRGAAWLWTAGNAAPMEAQGS